MEPYTHLIWDFNGTLYDDVDASIRSANRLLSAYHLPLIQSKAQYQSLFCFPVINYYKRLGFDFEALSYATLAREWLTYYMEESRSSVLYSDIRKTLEEVKKTGIAQMVLSATELGMLTGQLELLGIRPYFDELLGLDNIQAHSKTEVGKRWREKHPEARLVLFGDTDHDAQTAGEIGADCVLIATGHQSRETLEKCPCLFVADSAAEARKRVFGD